MLHSTIPAVQNLYCLITSFFFFFVALKVLSLPFHLNLLYFLLGRKKKKKKPNLNLGLFMVFLNRPMPGNMEESKEVLFKIHSAKQSFVIISLKPVKNYSSRVSQDTLDKNGAKTTFLAMPQAQNQFRLPDLAPN